MQLWFNRCLFGIWENQDKGLPYPPTYDGMAIAINDYLAARIGINVAIQLEASLIYHLTAMRGYKTHLGNLDYYDKSRVESYEEKMLEALRESCREIDISVALPNYKPKISDYDGVLRLFDRKNNELITLNITKGETYPILELVKDSLSDILIQCGKHNEPLDPARKKDQLVPSKVVRVESYDEAVNPENQEKLNYFQIFYKVGEYAFSGADDVYLQIRYWPQGKTAKNADNKSEAVKPLLMFYTYKYKQ